MMENLKYIFMPLNIVIVIVIVIVKDSSGNSC